MKPDPKPPLFADELRSAWEQDPSPTVRKLLWEIYRLRQVILTVDHHFQVIARVWKADVGGRLVAMEHLRVLLYNEATIAEERLRAMGKDPRSRSMGLSHGQSAGDTDMLS